MSGKPSRVKQREIKQIVAAAMQAGATKVVVKLGEACIEAHLPATATTPTTLDLGRNEWLEGDDAHQA